MYTVSNHNKTIKQREKCTQIIKDKICNGAIHFFQDHKSDCQNKILVLAPAKFLISQNTRGQGDHNRILTPADYSNTLDYLTFAMSITKYNMRPPEINILLIQFATHFLGKNTEKVPIPI